VFTGNHGTPVDPQTLNRRFTARCGQTGVRHMTVHDARRTCATLLVALEVHPRVIMRIGRHADVSMTLEIYANARADGDARSAAQAGGSPFDAQVNSRLRCCTGRILLLYWQQRGPHQIW
jgi:integrase